MNVWLWSSNSIIINIDFKNLINYKFEISIRVKDSSKKILSSSPNIHILNTCQFNLMNYSLANDRDPTKFHSQDVLKNLKEKGKAMMKNNSNARLS